MLKLYILSISVMCGISVTLKLKNRVISPILLSVERQKGDSTAIWRQVERERTFCVPASAYLCVYVIPIYRYNETASKIKRVRTRIHDCKKCENIKSERGGLYEKKKQIDEDDSRCDQPYRDDDDKCGCRNFGVM